MAPDDSQARRRLLFERGHANLQRRRREATLSKLPPELAAVLLSRPCIYSPEADRVIRQVLPISAHGIGGGSKPPPGYSFTEVSRQVAALAAVENLDKPDSQMPGYLLFPTPSVLSLQGEQYWVPDQPLFVVNFSWALSKLKQLWPFSNAFIALVAHDFATGVIIDNYCGYLADDPSPEEIVYEVAVWPSVSRSGR